MRDLRTLLMKLLLLVGFAACRPLESTPGALPESGVGVPNVQDPVCYTIARERHTCCTEEADVGIWWKL